MWIFVLIVVIIVFITALLLLSNSIINMAFKEQSKDNDWDIAEDCLKDPESFRFYDKINSEEIFKAIDWVVHQNYEKITIDSFDGLKLVGRFFHNPEQKGIVLMAHGYQSWAALDFSLSSKCFFEMGYSILLIDQRAHNDSEGTYITFGINEKFDVKSWSEKLSELYPNIPIILCGVSMGASTVMMASSLDLPSSVKAIIADSGYTTPKEIFKEVAHSHGIMFTTPIFAIINLILKFKAKISISSCDTRIALKNNHLPILIVHGKSDTLVPFYMSQENYKVAKESADARLLLIDDANHVESFVEDKDSYTNEIQTLISKI